MEDLKRRLLEYISSHGGASPEEAAAALRVERGELQKAIDGLERDGAIRVDRVRMLSASVTEEGRRYIGRFPEEALRDELAKGPVKVHEIHDGIALGWAKKNGWIAIDGGLATLTSKGAESAKTGYPMRELLVALLSAPKNRHNELIRNTRDLAEALEKRKLITIDDAGAVAGMSLTKEGEVLAGRRTARAGTEIGQLNKEMLLSKSWKGKAFKGYDVNAPSDTVYPARLHPMREFLERVRRIWLNMGFAEVEGPIIESSFWNFDALFSPQDHPTREMQDTFFLSSPKTLSIDDVELMARVRSMHEEGWKGRWEEAIARQAVLRTHTTSVSARHIYKYANYDGDDPLRLFSIGKVFRNESIDYKHLAELHQNDGIIIGRKLSLANLVHTLREFYSQLGFEVRIKPSYFPFVEPGMEITYFDEKRGDWIELCGSGVIRREITKALGTKNTVLAWGAGLDRLLFNELGISSLTDLYRNDVDWLRARKSLMVH